MIDATARRSLCAFGAVVVLIGSGCPLSTVAIQNPRAGSLHDDPAVSLDVLVGRNLVQTATVVRVDGVDLIAALGLTPPFTGASGTVAIGGDLVAVSNFSYVIPAATDPIRLTATLAGLAAGDHTLEAEAASPTGGAPTIKSNPFAVALPFTKELEVLASAGTPPSGLLVIGSRVGAATLGESLAAPPVGIAGGGSLRSGFVPAAQRGSP
jgi:hypothetical protein